MLYKEFYAELGKLLYAVADVDKIITQQEKKELQIIVKSELVPFEVLVDEFGTDVAYYSEFEFEFSDEQIYDSDMAFESFIDFINEHHEAINLNMKNLCIRVAEEIALSYYKGNNEEKIILNKLIDRLNSIDIRKNNNPYLEEYNFSTNELDLNIKTVDDLVEIEEEVLYYDADYLD